MLGESERPAPRNADGGYIQSVEGQQGTRPTLGYRANDLPLPDGEVVPTVQREVAAYLNTLSLRSQSEDTRRTRSSHLREFARWCEARGVESPEILTRDLIAEYLLERQRLGRSPNTIAVKAGTIRSFLAFLLDRGNISRAPKVDSPRHPLANLSGQLKTSRSPGPC